LHHRIIGRPSCRRHRHAGLPLLLAALERFQVLGFRV